MLSHKLWQRSFRCNERKRLASLACWHAASSGACSLYRYVLHAAVCTYCSLGLDYLNMGECAGILIAYIVICRAIAYLGIRFIKW